MGPRLASHEGGGGWPGGVGGMPPGPFGAASLFGDGTYSGAGKTVEPLESATYSSTTSNTARICADINQPLSPGDVVTHYGQRCPVAATFPLYIIKITAANVYTVVHRQDCAHTGTGLEFFALPVPFAIPGDGAIYYIGQGNDTTTGATRLAIRNDSGTRFTLSGSANSVPVGTTGTVSTSSATGYFTACKRVRDGGGCIIQGGSVLQPDANGTITITGAATIAPDTATLCAFAMGKHLVLDGAGASLTPTVACRGLFLAFRSVTAVNGARLSMTRFGLGGQVTDNPTLYDLIPTAYRRKFKRTALQAYVLAPGGASGGVGVNDSAGTTGGNAPGKTGGGGGGGTDTYPQGIKGADGAAGTCFSGGAGGGANASGGGTTPTPAAPYGGAGGNGCTTGTGYGAGGGAGNPGGIRQTNYSDHGTNGDTGTGGLLVLLATVVSADPGSTIEAKGGNGGNGGAYAGGGGASGGGLIYLLSGTDAFGGTVSAAGGVGGVYNNTDGLGGGRTGVGGNGGVGSIIRTAGLC